MKHALAFLTASILLLGAAPPQFDDAKWLKDLHRSYAGFTFGDGQIDTISYDERAVRDHSSDTITLEHVRRIHLAYRADAHVVKSNVDESNGFTGKLFWYSDQNGFTTKIAGNGVPTTYAEDLIFTDAIALLPWQYLETRDENGTKVAVARARLDGGMPIDLFIDTKTGAYTKIDILGAGGDYSERILINSYLEPKPGIHLIKTWRYDGSSISHTNENVALNPIIADADVHPPAQSAHWVFGSAPVPITLTHDRIVVHATVDGVPGTFLLDTGADNIYFSGAFARRAKLTPMGHSAADTLYGTIKTDVARVDTIALGDNVLHDAIVYYGSDEIDPRGPDGLLGYPIFAASDVVLNFDDKALTFRDPLTQPSPPPGSVSVAGSFGEGQPSIPMALNKIYFDVILDTGNPREIVFPYGILPKYGLHLFAGRFHEGVTCGTLDPLTVGTLTYQEPTGCAAYGEGRWILAGLDFLTQFTQIDFDYPDGAISFVPKPKR